MPLTNKNQSGNVFIVIMLGVFLFGALMYMFSRSAQQGTGNITKQQAKVAAQEILNYAHLVEGAVDRVRRNGCSETEISFENDVVAGYEHTPPARDECKIFHDDGGKVSYLTPLTMWLDSSQNTENLYEEIYFSDSICVPEVGAGGVGCDSDTVNNEDLILVIPYLNQHICENINTLQADSATIIQDVGTIWDATTPNKFQGSFSDHSAIIDNPANTLIGITSLCIEGGTHPSTDTYHFYHVLLAR